MGARLPAGLPELGAVGEEIGRPPVFALTATASGPVRDEIVERLRMRDPFVLVRGFDRANIRLGVERFHHPEAKRRALVQRAEAAAGPGIVYVATRKATGEVAHALREAGIDAVAYHGGLGARQREQAQADFMEDRTRVIVATTAFGMGVDKPNVRRVFHHDVADSVDSSGRRSGGRAATASRRRASSSTVRSIWASGASSPGRGRSMATRSRRSRARSGTAPSRIEPGELKDEVELSDSRSGSRSSFLFDGATREPGGVCPRCGWHDRGRDACPVDGTALGPRDDLAEAALESAVRQSAEVLRLRHFGAELEARGGIAAALPVLEPPG